LGAFQKFENPHFLHFLAIFLIGFSFRNLLLDNFEAKRAKTYSKKIYKKILQKKFFLSLN